MASAPRIRHTIIQTRNVCSRAVLHEDTIIIRLARNLSREERREHIQSLLRRMMEQVLKEQRKKRIAPFRHLLEGGESVTVRCASGRRYRFLLIPKNRTTVQQLKKQRGWIVGIGPAIRRSALHRLLWNLLAREESADIATFVHATNRTTLRVPIRSVRLAFAKSQWGSCSASGIIMLNSALLFVPRRILRYIIVHELAHRLVASHSPRFWATVARAMPDYRRAYRELQNYRLPTL